MVDPLDVVDVAVVEEVEEEVCYPVQTREALGSGHSDRCQYISSFMLPELKG